MSVENVRLTGRTRYRQQRFTGKVILQVEVTFDVVVPCGPSVDVRHGTGWRDAKITDVTVYRSDE